MKNLKIRIYQIVGLSETKGTYSWYFDVSLITLILLNAIAIILESIPSLRDKFQIEFYYFEVFSVTFFSIEYVLRVWSANINSKFKRLFLGNIKYIFTPLALIDLLAILPFFLPMIGVDFRILRMLRLFRLLRLFKLFRYIKALRLMGDVFNEKKEELTISLIFTLFMLVMASSLMYYVEKEAQPENFSSIPQTMWWGIATLTTVGYGDVYPITALGKVLGGLIAILGIGLFALPTGILASGFSEQLSKEKLDTKIECPNCGKSIET